MKNKLIALVATLVMLFQAVAPVLAVEIDNETQTKLTPTYTPSSSYKSGVYYTQLCNVSLTGNQRADIIAVALSQVGYHEGGSISDMSGNSTSSGNYTEYGAWYGINPAAWCAMFVSWCARQAQIPTSVLKNSSCAGCSSSYFNIPYYNGNSYTPQAGDLFFTKSWSHVGIVASVSGSTFTTIEGNSSDKVTSHNYTISSYYFGVWTEKEPELNVPDHTLYPQPTRDLYYGCKGNDVKWLQAALWEVGYPESTYGIDGDFGQLTKDKVIQFQKDNGLDADGIFGTQSRNKMLELFTPYPANPWISVSSSTITIGQSVSFNFGADYATGYTIGINRGSDRLVTQDVSGSYSYTPPTSGTYSAYITAWNSRGIVDSGSCTFTVSDPMPAAPTVVVNSTFKVGDNVKISWNHVDYATHYWLHIYLKGGTYINQDVYNASSFTQVYNEEGVYDVYVAAIGSAGEAVSNKATFTVLPKSPSKPVVSVIPGYSSFAGDGTRDFETNTSIYWNACENTNAYEAVIYNADTGIGWQEFKSIGEPHLNVKWPAGNWYVVVSALNTNTGEWTLSEKTYFTVIEYYPYAYNFIEYNGHTYATLQYGVSDWHDAEGICEKLGGHLATITSEDEQNAVYDLVNSSNSEKLWWIGATDEENEGIWKWVTGESFSYTNWQANQPDDYISYTSEGESFLHMYGSDGEWNDVDGIANDIYLVQYAPSIVLELDYTLSTYNAQPTKSIEHNDHTYSIYTSIFYNWHDAEAFCEAKGGTLATITSEEEQEAILPLLDEIEFGFVWLGATDEESEGDWEWVTGEPFNYANWQEGEPNNSSDGENYLHLFRYRNNNWNDTNRICAYFILETVNTHTVTFRDGLTGNTISTAQVEHNTDAVLPTPPTHTGYTFTGWDSDGKNITADTTITAQYKKNEVSPDDPQLVVSSVTGKAGDEITVAVSVKNNPGFTSLDMYLTYDTSALELASVPTAGEIISGCQTFNSPNLTAMPYHVGFTSGMVDLTGDGAVLVLKFRIKDTVEAGTYTISVTADPENTYNTEWNEIEFAGVDGTVKVIEYTLGDANGDGKINTRDAVVILQYFAGWNITIDMQAADIDGNGKINTRDAVLILQYFAGYTNTPLS